MAFAAEGQVMEATEKLLSALWLGVLNLEFPANVPRMTYQEAMASYGSDKPDLRCKAKVV